MIIKTLIAALQLSFLLTMAQQKIVTPNLILADFTNQNARSLWRVVNDDVMGGISKSSISVSENNYLVFSGEVSLENNGGFASLRSPVHDYDFSNFTGFVIKVKGDDKTYSLSFRQTKYFTGFNYNQKFETRKNEWQIFEFPFDKFNLKYFGKVVEAFDKPDQKSIKQISILISDKQEGPFQLEIEWIGLY
jgi:monofunctional biosynthetic peptidoglycan transglycosylase